MLSKVVTPSGSKRMHLTNLHVRRRLRPTRRPRPQPMQAGQRGWHVGQCSLGPVQPGEPLRENRSACQAGSYEFRSRRAREGGGDPGLRLDTMSMTQCIGREMPGRLTARASRTDAACRPASPPCTHVCAPPGTQSQATPAHAKNTQAWYLDLGVPGGAVATPLWQHLSLKTRAEKVDWHGR